MRDLVMALGLLFWEVFILGVMAGSALVVPLFTLWSTQTLGWEVEITAATYLASLWLHALGVFVAAIGLGLVTREEPKRGWGGY